MPRKKSFELTMKEHDPLSPRRYYDAIIDAIDHEPGPRIRFDLRILDDPNQEGRIVPFTVTANLTPGNPLATFLENAFQIPLQPGESIDLENLISRRFQAKFAKAEKGHPPEISKVRSYDDSRTTNAAAPAKAAESTVPVSPRGSHGLAENR